MTYVAIKDMKKSKLVGELLKSQRDLVITRDGRPFAIMVSVSPDSVEQSLSEIRRAMFSTAVMNARRRAHASPPRDGDVAREVAAARKPSSET